MALNIPEGLMLLAEEAGFLLGGTGKKSSQRVCAGPNPAAVFGNLASGGGVPDAGNQGAEVIKLEILEPEAALAGNPCNWIDNAQLIAERGIRGEVTGLDYRPTNRYAWSATSLDGSTYVSTFNLNINIFMLPVFASAFLNPTIEMWELLDLAARVWTGSPISFTTGGEIYKYDEDADEWTHEFTEPNGATGFRASVATPDFVAFGSANSEKGPNTPLQNLLDLLQDIDAAADSPGDYPGIFAAIMSNPAWLAERLGIGLYEAEDLYGARTNSYGNGVGAMVYSNKNGPFEAVDSGSALTNYDRSIRSMCYSSKSGKVWMGTETVQFPPDSDHVLGGTCSAIVSWDTATDTFERFDIMPLTHGICPNAVSACTEYADGRIVFGTWNLLQPLHPLILVDENGAVPTVTTVPGSPPTPEADGIMQLVMHKDCLNLFTYTQTGSLGSQGMRLCKNVADIASAAITDWDEIVSNGWYAEQLLLYGSEDAVESNSYTWSTAIVEDILFAGTINGDRSAQLWASLDGDNWSLCNDNSFGLEQTLGLRSMTVSNNTLYIGTASSMTAIDYNSPPYSTIFGQQPGALQGMLEGNEEFAEANSELLCILFSLLEGELD